MISLLVMIPALKNSLIKFSFFGLFVLLITLLAEFGAVAQTQTVSPLPPPTGMVNDYAGIIDETTKARLEKRLRDLQKGTNPPIEIAVVTVKTTGDKDIFDYSLAVARGWGIGAKQDDNPSVLLLIAVDDHKYFTQTSRDAEGDLNDGLIGQYQRQYLVPAFRQGQYAQGISDTVEAYIRRFAEQRGFDANTLGKTTARARPQTQPDDAAAGGVFMCCVILIIIFIILLFILSAFRGRGGRGGGSGGGFIPPIIWTGGGFGGGGGSSDWGSSGGGGGDSWGGFGGGGDFGGGGAGGDW